MGIKLKFVQDDTANDVEIIIRAKEQNEEVEKILKLLGKRNDNNIICNVLSNEQLVDIKDIIIISKDGRYLSVKTINGQYILNEPLYKIEEKLDKSWFVKISQSEIVNLKYVKKWSLCTGGIIKIELQNDIQSYTSRRYATLIKEILRKGGGKR
ncbi:MAG: LytTR family transcriptional regulator [Acholeplasmatales bacterium]|nr:LytTR family transcriptional regulator [Acholeplasmatales bacterium]